MQVPYSITFKPLAMSSAEQPHEGSAFFPIPDGSGLLYKLSGRAETPVPEGTVERALTAKAPHTEVLRVANWLHKPQRFKVSTHAGRPTARGELLQVGGYREAEGGREHAWKPAAVGVLLEKRKLIALQACCPVFS